MPVFKTVSQWTVFQWSFEKTFMKTNDKKSEIHSDLKFPHSWFPSNLIIFPPHSFFPLPPHFLLFSLLLHNFIIIPSPPPPSHLFYIFFHPQIHRPHIDPASTLDSFFVFEHNFVDMYIVKLYTTTTTFLLFLLFTKLTFFDYFNRISNLNGGPVNLHH